MIKLFGKPIKVNKASQDKRTQDCGANLFIGNLDQKLMKKCYMKLFSNFGMIINTKITRDPEKMERVKGTDLSVLTTLPQQISPFNK